MTTGKESGSVVFLLTIHRIRSSFPLLCLGLRLPFVSPSPLFPRLVVPPTFGHEANE